MSPTHATPPAAPTGGMTPDATPLMLREVLVASDGLEESGPALGMARLLAARGAAVDVASVVEPIPVVASAGEVPLFLPEVDDSRRTDALRRVRAQAANLLGDVKPASVQATLGRPAEEIARLARASHAGLVITGMRHHGRLDRIMLRGDTPLAIARSARVPVLTVPVALARLPRVALIAVDLDEASVTAARAARPLLGEVEKVYVVHVRNLSTGSSSPAAHAWEAFYEKFTADTFSRVVEALGLPAGTAVERRTLTGHPVDELLEFAQFAGVELIVTGYRKRLLLDRMSGPRSVAERVYRGARCAVMLVPESATLETGQPSGDTRTLSSRDDWGGELAAFSKRNSGRAADLEIDTRDFGAQAQVIGLPLAGIDYEDVSDAVHVMFGDPGGRPHLVHSIVHPTALQIRRGHGDKDLALRIAHEDGYSLLMFMERGFAPGGMTH